MEAHSHACVWLYIYALTRNVRDDVTTLEREFALYSDHWIDELKDFRHVSIRLPISPCSRNIVFVVIDVVRDLPDPRLIERQLTGKRKGAR